MSHSHVFILSLPHIPIPMSSFITPHPHSPFPTFPGGQSQYVSLPADPRVLSGEYMYAVLQPPDGPSQIVLMENSSISEF